MATELSPAEVIEACIYADRLGTLQTPLDRAQRMIRLLEYHGYVIVTKEQVDGKSQ